jgi:hypothetical protein
VYLFSHHHEQGDEAVGSNERHPMSIERVERYYDDDDETSG